MYTLTKKKKNNDVIYSMWNLRRSLIYHDNQPSDRLLEKEDYNKVNRIDFFTVNESDIHRQ